MDVSKWELQIDIPHEVHQLDIEFFRDNPSALSYIRYYIPGELPEDEEDYVWKMLKETPACGPRMVRVCGAFGRPVSNQYFLQWYPNEGGGVDINVPPEPPLPA